MNSGKHPWLTGVLIGTLTLLAPVTGAWGATPLSNLILRPQDGFTELLVPGVGKLLCDHSSQEAVDGHPFRIVLDFCDADHALGRQTFDALPPTVIERIRTSQYAQTPQRIVRVVLDLRRSATYTVKTEQNTATVRIVDPDRATFARWEARPGSRPTLASKTGPESPAKPAATIAAPASGAKQTTVQTAGKTTTTERRATTVAESSKPTPSTQAKRAETKISGASVAVVKYGPPTPTAGTENKNSAETALMGTPTKQAAVTPSKTIAKPSGTTTVATLEPVQSQSKAVAPSKTIAKPSGTTTVATLDPVQSQSKAAKPSKTTAKPSGTTTVATPEPVQFQSKVVPNEGSKPTATKTVPSGVKEGGTSSTVSLADRGKPLSTPTQTSANTAVAPPPASVAPSGTTANTQDQSLAPTVTAVPTGEGTNLTGTLGQAPRDNGFVLPSRPLVLVPEYLNGDDQTAQNQSTGQDKVPVAQVSMNAFGPQTPGAQQGGASTAPTTPLNSSMLAATTTQPLMNANAGAIKPGDSTLAQNSGKTGQETLFDRLRSKFFNEQTPPRPYTSVDLPGEGVAADSQAAGVYGPPTPAIMLTREELLEKVRQAAENAGAQPGTFADQEPSTSVNNIANRKVVIYDDMGRRDPFAPLSKGLRSGFVSDQLPSVENLRLVGVLRDDKEAMALLENLEGYGYVMRVGDKVENGTVAAIQENRVLFRVQDYGWSHIVALQLTTRGADPSKTLGAKSPTQLEYEESRPMQEPSTRTTETPKTESAKP